MQQMQKGHKLWGKFIELSNRWHYVGTSEHQPLPGAPCLLAGANSSDLCIRNMVQLWWGFVAKTYELVSCTHLQINTHTHRHTHIERVADGWRILAATSSPAAHSSCQQISNQRRNERTVTAAGNSGFSSGFLINTYIDLCVSWSCSQKRKWNFCQLNYEHQMRFTLWCDHLSVYKSKKPSSDSVLAKLANSLSIWLLTLLHIRLFVGWLRPSLLPRNVLIVVAW